MSRCRSAAGVEAGAARRASRARHARQRGSDRVGRRRVRVALAHHHPAAHSRAPRAVLVDAGRCARRRRRSCRWSSRLQADHLGRGAQRVARIDRREEAHVGVAEVGDRVERDVGHGLAEGDVEDEQVVDRAVAVARGARERLGAVQRIARAGERDVERAVARR